MAHGGFAVVFTTDDIYFSANGLDNDYQVIQAVVKPAAAKYLGFGEQGGIHLAKNQEQLTYFNYDNMRYRQVYGKGPLEPREPLYHSDPFFIELNGTHEESVYGIYIDNPSEICVDVGYLHSQRYLFGTRFGGLDYYFFLGENVASITKSFSSVIGRSKLKPRYILGYHQGCYGYDTKQKVEEAARGYRDNGIPLDGIHIDIDIQHSYQTFTIDKNAFHDPKGMFDYLRSIGVKCSTNITPIISNRDQNYSTFKEALSTIDVGNNRKVTKLIKESRYGDWKDVSSIDDDYWYKDFGEWHKIKPRDIIFNNGNEYYVGEVYYGDNSDGTPRGTTGHYPNLYNLEVRKWWGRQYQYLFDQGLEFVWQDMTTPAIRATRGDYKSFPLKLLVESDWMRLTKDQKASGSHPDPVPVLKAWNLFSYNLHKATYHGLSHIKGREEKRNFIIGRGSFSGMHRYAGLWTGDNSSTWDFYRINVSQALALGICGMSINGQDIGGFETEGGGKWVDPELLIRWTSTGAFLPWFRNHYQAKNNVKYFQEPWKFPRTEDQLNYYNIPQQERYLYRTLLPSCKYYIELRYRLLQLFYDAMFENMFSGIPISRALVIVEPQDKTLYNDNLSRLSSQFFVGQDLLVAPVLQPDSDYPEHSIYLPSPSHWYLFKNNRSKLDHVLPGGTTVRQFDAKINDDPNHIPFLLPIYVRAGAIIPTIERENWVGELNSKGIPNPITFNIYPGRNDVRNRDLLSWAKELYPHWVAPKSNEVDGEYHLFLDDGVTVHAAPQHLAQFRNDPALPVRSNNLHSQYRHTYITHKRTGNVKTITFTRLWDQFTPPLEKYFFVAILHEVNEPSNPLTEVKVNGVAAQPLGGPDQVNNATDNAWYWNSDINISFAKVFDKPTNTQTPGIVQITVEAKYK